MDQRFEQLSQWLARVLKQTGLRLEPASGDASFRRYFRVFLDGSTFIAMDAPPDRENSEPYIRISAWLREMGLNAPDVLQQQPSNGFYLLTDLGDRQYLDYLNNDSVDELYQDALDALLIMQTRGTTYQSQLPPYDRALLSREMQLFTDWYLTRHLGIELTPDQLAVVQQTHELLIDNALQQPVVFVHRDYHSRNLMLQPRRDDNPGILDFQDAVYGPVSYDLVSLLRDCYISWPDEEVYKWVKNHFEMLREHGQLSDSSFDQYKQWFDLMGVQRHLKASGIFARLNYRDGKPGYLNDIPRTLGYIFRLADDYPQLVPFIDLMNDLCIPEKLKTG